VPPPAGDDPQPDLGPADHRSLEGHAEIGCEREFTAPAEDIATDGGDDRCRKALDRVGDPIAEFGVLLGLSNRQFAHVLDVRAVDGRIVARPGQHERSGVVFVACLPQRFLQCLQGLGVERVQPVGPGSGDCSDTLARVECDGIGRTRADARVRYSPS